MKKLMVVMMSVASLGVFADQEADTNASTSANQIVTSGGNGGGTRMDALQKRTQAKRSSIVRVETSKVDSFLQAHFGVKFGDSIDGFTNVVQLIGGEARTLPVLKAVGRLNSAIGRFRNGKLRTVHFVAPGVCKEHTAPVPDDLQKSYVCVAKELGIDPSDVKPLGLVFGDAGYFMEWNAPLWDKDCNGIYNVQIEGPLASAMSSPSRRSSYLGLGRRSHVVDGVEPPKEIYEKIPEEHQATLRSKINDLAGKQSAEEASDKFGVLLTPRSWTNGCGKGMIVSIQGDRYRSSLFLKCDRDGKIVQLGELPEFAEFKWRNARRGEIVTNLWNDQKLVDGLLATAVSNAAQKVEGKRQQREKDQRRLERLNEQVARLNEQINSAVVTNFVNRFHQAEAARSNAAEKADQALSKGQSLKKILASMRIERGVAEASNETVDEMSDYLKRSRREMLPRFCDTEAAVAIGWEQQWARDSWSGDYRGRLQNFDLGQFQTNVDAFVMRHFSVRFGDSITNFHKVVVGGKIDYLRDIPVKDKFKHLNCAIGRFAADKLYEIFFLVDVPKKYSKASAEARVDQDIIEMVEQLGVPIEFFKPSMSFLLPRSPYTLQKLQVDDLLERPFEGYGKPDGVYRLGVVISAKELHNKFATEEIEKEREARAREENKGEEFPEVK